MRVITHRSIQKLDLAAALGQFVDQQHLMDIVARQAIGCSDQEQLEGGKGGTIAQAVQTGPVEFGPTIPIIAIDMFVGLMPVLLLGDMGQQPVDLLVNRLGVLLAACRDTNIECNFHEVPPVAVLVGQAHCLPRLP